MKILHLNYYDIKGGAALAAYRLCKQQRALGIDASMVVVEKFSREPWIIPLSENVLKKMRFLQRCEAAVCKIAEKKENFMPRSFNLISLGGGAFIQEMGADMVHLHWINGQMLSIDELASLRLPVLWTLHDNWGYCGSEHYHLAGDERFKKGYCGHRPEDWIWRKKCRAWQNFHPVIVGPSVWITREAAESKLFQKCRIEHIFNGIDSNEFKPVDKAEARRYWGLPADKSIIVVGAASLANENKGGKLLKDTLAHFPDISVLAIGANVSKELHPGVVCAGNLTTPEMLALAYSCGDLFLSVARYDNLPNMLIEAIACGTPVVAVETGGVKEIVGNSNGITTPPESEKLAAAVRKILEKEHSFELSVKNFDIKNTAEKYLKLYESIMTQKQFG